ncbi:hypothetical protein HK096_007233, partial [Nowakowskiella sp. JEL0078]
MISAGGFQIEQQLYQAAALAALTLFGTAHRAVAATGFHMSNSFWTNTDCQIGLIMCLIAMIWTGLVLLSGFVLDDHPCSESWIECGARLANAPILLIVTCVFWCATTIDFWLLMQRLRKHSQERVESGEEDTRALLESSDHRLPARGGYLWQPNYSAGYAQFNANLSLSGKIIYFGLCWISVGIFAAAALYSKQYVIGLLPIIGPLLVTIEAVGKNPYATFRHVFGKRIQITLITDHLAGTTYVFEPIPKTDEGAILRVTPVWTPRVTEQHELLRHKLMPAMLKLRSQADSNSVLEMVSALRSILTDFVTKVDPTCVKSVGKWLALGSCNKKLIVIDMDQTQHLLNAGMLSSDLVLAIAYLEFFTFVNRDRLDKGEANSMWKWRAQTTTGAVVPDNSIPYQFSGIEGWELAVKSTIQLFGIESKQQDLLLTGWSEVERKEWITKTWDMVLPLCESVFVALYIFYCIYETNRHPSDAYAPFVLRTRHKFGDFATYAMMWRQGWYCCVFAQLSTLSPAILSAFVTG